MTPSFASTGPSRRGFFVTVSLVGMLTLIVLFAALVGQYAQQYGASETYASAQKMSGAERDISAALSSLYSFGLGGTYDNESETITVSQGPMLPESNISEFRNFASNASNGLPLYYSMQMNLSGNSSAGFNATWPGQLVYSYNRSGSAELGCFNTSTSGSTGVVAYSISIYSPVIFNKSTEDCFNQTDGILVNLSYAYPGGSEIFQRTLNGSENSTFQLYDNNSLLFANVSVGNLSSCNGALRLGFGPDVPAQFNITFSQNRTSGISTLNLSEWHFPDTFSASLMGVRLNRLVEVQVRR